MARIINRLADLSIDIFVFLTVVNTIIGLLNRVL
jgi:hypothetical protein